MEIANTILAQLGGRRFIAMVGAKSLVAFESGLSFKIGRNSKGVTHVRITLTAADLYRVEFLNCRGVDIQTKAAHDGIYADNLRRIFTAETGMHTSL